MATPETTTDRMSGREVETQSGVRGVIVGKSADGYIIRLACGATKTVAGGFSRIGPLPVAHGGRNLQAEARAAYAELTAIREGRPFDPAPYKAGLTRDYSEAEITAALARATSKPIASVDAKPAAPANDDGNEFQKGVTREIEKALKRRL